MEGKLLMAGQEPRPAVTCSLEVRSRKQFRSNQLDRSTTLLPPGGGRGIAPVNALSTRENHLLLGSSYV